jgi:hypothetical protein
MTLRFLEEQVIWFEEITWVDQMIPELLPR